MIDIRMDDLLTKREIERIFADAKHIADRLEDVWRFLDEIGYRLNLASDRAAVNRISQAARDFVLAVRPQ